MLVNQSFAIAALAAGPFAAEIAPNGYHVKDCKGYTWATCRNEAHAQIICEALHVLAAERK